MIPLPFAEISPDDIMVLIFIFFAWVWPAIKKRLRPQEEAEPVVIAEEPLEEPTLVEKIREIAQQELGIEAATPPPVQINPDRAHQLHSELKSLRGKLATLLPTSSRGPNAALANHVASRVEKRLKGIDGAISRYLAGNAPDYLERLEGECRYLKELIAAIMLLLQERVHPDRGRVLVRGDAFFQAWYRPFYGKNSLPVATHISLPRRAHIALETSKIIPCVVPVETDASPSVWGLLSHTVGRTILRRAPDVARELAWRLRGNPDAAAPGQDGRIYRSDLDNLVAAWSEVLFADAVGTFLLGTAYLQALMHLTVSDRNRATIGIDVHRASIAPAPPAVVREVFVLRMLAHMGLAESAERQMYHWRKKQPSPEVLTLPVGGKRFAEVPLKALDGALDPFFQLLEEGAWESLGGKRLDGLNDLLFTGSMNESAHALTSRALRGEDLKTHDRIRLATAVFAEGEDVTAARRIWAAVDGVSLAKSRRSAAGTTAETSHQSRKADLRDALIWREILLPRPGSLRAQRARFQP